MSAAPAITVADLARRLGQPFEGDGSRTVRGVQTLERAGPDELSWAADPKHLSRLGESRAAVILVPKDCAVPEGATVIRVSDPDLALCEALEALAPEKDTVPLGVHPSATVDPSALVEGAAIGPHVRVGPHARIGPGTQLHAGVWIGSHTALGRDCVLWPNVVVRERVTLGERVIIHPNTTIGADGFGYLQRDGRNRKIPQIGTVVIEDDVEIGANCAVDRARSGVTRIARGVKIDNLVQIGHNTEVGEHSILVGQCGIGGSTVLGRRVVLGGQAGVIDHLRIGDGVQAAARALLTRDVAAGQLVQGSPATEIQQFARQLISVRKLPETVKQLRALAKRVEQLESAANHPARD